MCYPKEQILALFGTHKLETDNAELVQQLQAEIAKIKQEKLEAIQGYKDAYSDYLEKYKQEVSVLKGHLEQQAQDKQATIDRQAKEIADLKSQLEQQANQPCETVLDDEMETKSLNAVSRLVYVLLDMAEYDLSTHSGNGNTSIIARSERLLQKPLSKKFVSDWIKNAQTVKIEYGKK